MSQSWRPLGVTYHTARVHHECDRCCHPIEPGDFYERFVERRGRRLLVWKYHNNPDCPPRPEHDYEEVGEKSPYLSNDNHIEQKGEKAA